MPEANGSDPEIVVFIMASSKAEAEAIGKQLVKDHRVACSNICSGIRSCFIWKGNFCEEEEVLLICKTLLSQLDGIIDRVGEIHQYEVPEIIALPIVGGSEDYIRWLRASIH